MFCTDISEPTYLIFSSFGTGLLYYSHIPSMIISLCIGIFVYLKDPKSLINKILLFLGMFFSLWVFLSLVIWVNVDSRLIMFSWSLIALLFSLISFSSYYFIYVFINKKDLPFKFKLFWLILISPIILLTPSSLNLSSFDSVYCQANEGLFFTLYYYIIGLFTFLAILWTSFKTYCKSSPEFKKQIIIISIGLEAFLLSFFFSSFLASYLVDAGLSSDFNMEFYGLFGMIIFISFLAFMIVRFKAFNIKMLGSQVLVISLVVIISSEFLFIQDTLNKVLVALTLVIASVIGLILIRSVKKVDSQKELLEISNNEQENLIHFISHQVKGFFTKSRNIFSTLDDEKKNIDPKLFKYIEEGLRSDDEGIALVESILNASNFKTGKISLMKEEFSLNELMKKVCDLNRTFIGDKDIKFHCHFLEKELKFVGDQLRLEDALNNIIQNSVKYTEQGGIFISLTEEFPKKILITVKDTGIGLSDKDKSRLFTSGGRGEESLKYNVNSTGYGLYISKKIIEGHGGTIKAKSEGRGKGSTFTIILPARNHF